MCNQYLVYVFIVLTCQCFKNVMETCGMIWNTIKIEYSKTFIRHYN
jgi:hypothetical protein